MNSVTKIFISDYAGWELRLATGAGAVQGAGHPAETSPAILRLRAWCGGEQCRGRGVAGKLARIFPSSLTVTYRGKKLFKSLEQKFQ